MPNRLHRYYGAGYLHFITTSCYQRRALLGRRAHRDLFLQVLEQVRKRYGFIVVGYVVMPEHVHLLIGEPERANPSVVMQALKQSFARRLQRKLRGHDNPRQGSLWNAALAGGPHKLRFLHASHQNDGGPFLRVLCTRVGTTGFADERLRQYRTEITLSLRAKYDFPTVPFLGSRLSLPHSSQRTA